MDVRREIDKSLEEPILLQDMQMVYDGLPLRTPSQWKLKRMMEEDFKGFVKEFQEERQRWRQHIAKMASALPERPVEEKVVEQVPGTAADASTEKVLGWIEQLLKDRPWEKEG